MMKIKTIRLKDNEYMSKEHYDVEQNFIILEGARGIGKSFAMSKEMVECNKRGRMWVYVRNSRNDLHTIDTYFYHNDENHERFSLLTGYNDFSIQHEIKRGVHGRSTVSIVGDKIVTGIDENGEEYEDVVENVKEQLGYIISLENASSIKSAQFPNVDLLVYEEANQANLTFNKKQQLAVNFLELVETVFRKRTDIKIFGLTNSIGGVSPLMIILSNFDNAIKLYFKKKNVEGVMSGLGGAFDKYLRGNEYQRDALSLRDYVQIMTVKLPKRDYYLYRSKDLSKILVHNKGTDVALTLESSLLVHQFDRVNFVFKDTKCEEYFIQDFEEIKVYVRDKSDELVEAEKMNLYVKTGIRYRDRGR